MKTKVVISILFLIFVPLCLFSQIKADCSGKISIGPLNPNSNYYLNVDRFVRFDNGGYTALIIDQSALNALAFYPSVNNSGNIGRSDKAFKEIYSYNYYDLNSDLKQKENIRNIPNALSLIKGLRGIKYDLIKSVALGSSKNDSSPDNDQKNRIGFIAQEMINVLPEAVHYVDSTDIYSIDYTRVIPVLVEAMKEQQNEIESLQKEVENLKLSQSNLKSAQLTTIYENTGVNSDVILYQNIPNPFTQSTSIGYFLPESVQSAMICIYNMNGMQLKCVQIKQKGYSNITISGNELKAGMYLYSIVADGELIDSKKMVLTD